MADDRATQLSYLACRARRDMLNIYFVMTLFSNVYLVFMNGFFFGERIKELHVDMLEESIFEVAQYNGQRGQCPGTWKKKRKKT